MSQPVGGACLALVHVPKVGRPRTPNEAAIKDAVCERIANGETRLEACATIGIPAGTVSKWLNQDEEFARRYARARVEQAHSLADRAVLISRHRPLTMPEAAGQRAELDTIKWLTSKIAPKLYGERILQEHTHRVGVVVLPSLPEQGQPLPMSDPESLAP